MSGVLETGFVVTGDAANPLYGVSDVEVYQTALGPFLAVGCEAEGVVSGYALAPPGDPVLVDRIGYSTSSGTLVLSDLVVIEGAGGEVSLVTLGRYDDNYGVYAIGDNGATSQVLPVATGGVFSGGAVGASLTINGRSVLYTGNLGQPGLNVFSVGTDGSLSHIQTFEDNQNRGLGAITAIHATVLHGTPRVFAASGFETRIESLGVTAAGKVYFVSGVQPWQDQGYAQVSDLDSLQIGDRAFLFAAASGTDSISVFRVSQGGRLNMVDHHIDTLETRYEEVQAIEAFEVGDRDFLVAAGGDDGVTLFEVTWNGRLVEIDTIADDFDTTLENPSSLAVRVVGETAHIYVGSATEHGVTELVVDLSRSGQEIRGGTAAERIDGSAGDDLIWGMGHSDTLFGHDGDDRLVDGRGRDRLTGGAGADTFVFIDDGRSDFIEDFEPGVDRIDLTDFDFVNHIDDLVIAPRKNGAVIIIGDEVIRLVNPEGGPMDVSGITENSFIFG